MLVREEKNGRREDPGLEEKKKKDDEKPPEKVDVPANTIVVNTNRVLKEYAAYCIYHEFIHYEYHYLFFRLQLMGNNDPRAIRTKKVKVGPGEKVTDPLYWMEKQANRGAYGLLLPISWMKQEVDAARGEIQEYRHQGDLYERIGRKICWQYGFAHFRMRARLIQMGRLEAKGSLNWLPGGVHLEPFAFEVGTCRRIVETFIIDRYDAGCLYETNKPFRELFDNGKYICADGHIVRKDPRFIRESGGRTLLTPWANAHVNKCCLRFLRVYTQAGVGRYVFGRMNYDAAYVAKTLFYLDAEGDQEMVNEVEAEKKYADQFLVAINDGLKQIMAREQVSQEKMAELLDVDDRTFKYWLADADKRYTEDFIMMFSLALSLPDWVSDILFDRAGLALSEKNPRHLALRWIQHAMWDQGIEKANAYLMRRKYKPLEIRTRKKP